MRHLLAGEVNQGGVRSFNLLRLREIAQQRDETARAFDGGAGDKADSKDDSDEEDSENGGDRRFDYY